MPPAEFMLDGVPADAINASLRDDDPNGWTPQALIANKNRCLEGASPKAGGLVVHLNIAGELLSLHDAPNATETIGSPGERNGGSLASKPSGCARP